MKKRKIVFLAIVGVLLLAVLFGIGYAWLINDTNYKNKVVISDFETKPIVCFMEGSGDENLVNPELIQKQTSLTGMLTINLTDPNAENYIGKLRVGMQYNGASPAYVRIRVLEQWTEDDEFIAARFTPYTIPADGTAALFSTGVDTVAPDGVGSNAGGWFDNRLKDFCYYFTLPVIPKKLDANSQGSVFLTLINGITDQNIAKMTNIRDSVDLKLVFQLEAVQPNRFRELWNIEKLPWKE